VVGVERLLIRVAQCAGRGYNGLVMLGTTTLTAQSLVDLTRVMKVGRQAKISCDAVTGGIEKRFAAFANFLAAIEE
jgi:hypothetical protein